MIWHATTSATYRSANRRWLVAVQPDLSARLDLVDPETGELIHRWNCRDMHIAMIAAQAADVSSDAAPEARAAA